MKVFNVSKQHGALIQAWMKEYINRINVGADSIYQYLHYYNPEWKLVAQDETYTGPNSLSSNNLFTGTTFNAQNLAFRWGYKNETSNQYRIGSSNAFVNVGATIFKRDAYDLTSVVTQEDLSHFILFEASLGHFYNYYISQEVENGQVYLLYNWFVASELDYGLSYSVQVPMTTPRHCYCGDYTIRQPDSANDMDLDDMANNQKWCGNTEIDYLTYANFGNREEEVICDSIITQRHAQHSFYKVYLGEGELGYIYSDLGFLLQDWQGDIEIQNGTVTISIVAPPYDIEEWPDIDGDYLESRTNLFAFKPNPSSAFGANTESYVALRDSGDREIEGSRCYCRSTNEIAIFSCEDSISGMIIFIAEGETINADLQPFVFELIPAIDVAFH